MIEVNPLLNRSMGHESIDRRDIFHTSAYARMQNPEGIGAASTESYGDRVKRKESRQKIGSYAVSGIVGGTFNNAPRAKTYTPPQNNGGNIPRSPMPPKTPSISR